MQELTSRRSYRLLIEEKPWSYSAVKFSQSQFSCRLNIDQVFRCLSDVSSETPAHSAEKTLLQVSFHLEAMSHETCGITNDDCF